ncbi:MAG: fimbria/pilus outer membrane usher protein [Hyphomicrobium sp.]
MHPPIQPKRFSGQWRISPLLLSAFWLGFTILFGHSGLAWADEIKYADEITGRLNPTGRTVTIPVPLRDQSQVLGDALIQITADDQIFVEKKALLTQVARVASPSAIKFIKELPDQTGFTKVSQIAFEGLSLSFDPGVQELVLTLATEQRPTEDFNLGLRPTQSPSSTLTDPEWISGYINVAGGIDQLWDTGIARGAVYEDQPSGRVELEAVGRVGGVVMENRAAYEGSVDVAPCPPTAICSYGHVAGLKRQRTRLVYDLSDDEIRVSLGDTDPLIVPLQRATDTLGISIEKSARKLNPGANITSTGGGSFRLEHSANIDVRVNGASIQQLRLRPGNYNLRDLPLSTGANNIELVITDDNGEKQSLFFNTYADASLLKQGVSEWAVSAGAPSYLLDNQRTYASDDFIASAYMRYGLTDEFTGAANFQADLDVVLGGGGGDLGTPFGLFGLNASVSTSAPGIGLAVDFDWSLVNANIVSQMAAESLFFAAEYRSENFHTPGEFLTEANGILFPEFNYWLRLSGSYSRPLWQDITATASVRYQFDDESRQSNSAYQIVGDRYGADITLSAPLTSYSNASLTVGYSNELYTRIIDEPVNIDPSFRIGVRFNIRPDDTTTISGSYDTLGNEAGLSVQKAEGSGVGRWDTSVDMMNNGYQDTANISATAGYYGNRAEVRLSHFADADNFHLESIANTPTRQRTSFRVGTALAFAGDKFAIGAPVRGDAFAIVAPHESLKGHDITVGNADSPRAIADAWGNGLVTDIPAYTPSSTPIDVADLPIGYSLGSGGFDTYAPYKAGYVFNVGSENSVSVYGTLLGEDGQPLALVTGTARPQGRSAEPVSVFTNGQGRFGAEGIGPGRWIIEMMSDQGPLHYAIDVPEGSQGLVKVGSLHPTRGQPE